MENKVIAKEYVDKNYIHKDVIKLLFKDIVMVNEIPVKNTRKKQVYKTAQILWYIAQGGLYDKLVEYHIKKLLEDK